MDELDEALRDDVYDVCRQFIIDNHISSMETVYQSDRVIENAYDFIAELLRLIGPCEYSE